MQTNPTNPGQHIISLDDVGQTFTAEHGVASRAVADVSLNIERGSFVSIVGPSGCGKSTLLRIMAGLEKPTHGVCVTFYEMPAMVFQNFALFPWLTVLGNVEFGLHMAGIPAHESKMIAEEKIHEVGLAGHEKKYPRELSGGMRQRVSIARALAVSPDILFMDEPFSSLDPFTADILKKDIIALWQKYKMTIVMVSHMIEDAIVLSDKVLVMSSHPGTVIGHHIVHMPRPRDTRSADFYQMFDAISASIKI